MEVYRRATGGRLSEMFGPATLRADKRFLALGLRRAAAAEWQTATPDVRSALEHYAAGVNAAIGGDGTLAAAAGVPAARRDARAVDAGRLAGRRAAAGLAPRREPAWRAGARPATRAVGAAEANLLLGAVPPDAPAILDAMAPARQASPAVPRTRPLALGPVRVSRRRHCRPGSSGST